MVAPGVLPGADGGPGLARGLLPRRHAPSGLARRLIADVREDRRQELAGRLPPARAPDVDLALPAHPVGVEERPQRVLRGPAVADGVGDVEQREAHLRGDVTRHSAGERVGGVGLAEPRAEVVVEPELRLEAGADDLQPERVEDHALVLLDVGEDEVDELRARPAGELGFERADGGAEVRDEGGHHGGVGVEERRRAGGRAGDLRGRVAEVPALDEPAQRAAHERVAAEDLEQLRATGRGGQRPRDVDEEAAARLGHRRGGRQLPEGEPQGLHGVGHHLLVPDGDVDVEGVVRGLGEREERRDRPRLDHREALVVQAPLEVLRGAERRLDAPAQRHELERPRVGEHPGARRAPVEHVALADVQPLGLHAPGDERLARPVDRLDHGGPAVARQGVGREEHARRARPDHPLHHDGHRGVVGAAALGAVGDRPRTAQRRPDPVDRRQDGRGSDHVELRVVQAGERREV